MRIMKYPIILAFMLLVLSACTIETEEKYSPEQSSSEHITGNLAGLDDLVLDELDLDYLGLIDAGQDCSIQNYETSNTSPLAQYNYCNYTFIEINDSWVVVELSKFTNKHDLNGSYQYSSLHLRGLQGLISEDSYGDMSRFYVNNEYTIYYYHLWIVKDNYLIHITSKGSEDAKSHIESIGKRFISKFEV